MEFSTEWDRRKKLLSLMDNETEFIPLFTPEDEEQMNSEALPKTLPLLPLRNTVLYPGVVIPITVGRDKSIRLIKEAYRSKKAIGVVAQKDSNIEEPVFEDLYTVGTVAHIIKTLHMPDGSTTVIIQGKKRFTLLGLISIEPYFTAQVADFITTETTVKEKKFQALISSLKDMAIQIAKQSPNIPSDAAFAIKNIESPSFLVNFISSNLNIEITEKQKLLETVDITERANLVLNSLVKELQMIELKNQIQNKVKSDLDKQQRDFLLQQQIKQIQEELGENPQEQFIKELKEKATKKKWKEEVAHVFERDLSKLQRMNPHAAEYSVHTNYLETLVELPWNECTEDNFDLNNAQRILDEDHYGLEKVKERIIEYLAILKVKNDMKSPILCLIGPPGVGKTSLGKSIARALERKYVRMSLGGLRDEAELRGHRKTYIGAMPGRIIQNLKKAKSANPVFVLDEIDKVSGNNVNGDPQAALLEILDPEQNTNFYDNFLELDFDLSRVMFIATANNLSTIYPALRDRMEIIDLSGYIMEEKIQIAQRHLVPKQLREHGLKDKQIVFSDKIIELIIDDYTRESGVRALERTIAKIIRNRIKYIAKDEKYNKKIKPEELKEILGNPSYHKDKDIPADIAGVITGLAWTMFGGEILFIEVSLSKGKGNLALTGNLGDVMKESASIAYEYLKAHAQLLNISNTIFEEWNVHIHIPEGATPKDGPSAGITMFTALVSAFTQRKPRKNIAMTGEITLRGKVLPVGGIKEKILAAKRAKITDIILSKENIKDVEEINKRYLEGLNFFYVTSMLEVCEIALMKTKVSNPLVFA
ncbi:MAG: endopeptidase La [Bacteroidales bacterium]|jgi:ATP-dependent Lon protease|nr:endopeptidase La [Bacteroidales bacterium]MDD4214422.1 endopeptidase La [Bacteroidales bacterium]